MWVGLLTLGASGAAAGEPLFFIQLSEAQHGKLAMVTTGAIGKPLRKDVSGMRIVIVRDTGIEHRFYHLGELPNRIDLKPAKKPGLSRSTAPPTGLGSDPCCG